MSQPFIHRDHLHAPYFIFVQAVGIYSDLDLLRHLGVSHVAQDFTPSRATKSVFVTQDREWMHVADDWSYTLWHADRTRTAIAGFAMRHDIFTCCVGDVDRSFNFAYYQNARLVRQYVVDATLYGERSVVIDEGSPLPGEAEAMQAHEGVDIVLAIAQSLGINVNHDIHDIRTYTHI